MLLLALPEQPIADGCYLVAVVERCHMLHALARFRKDAAGFPFDEVDVAAIKKIAFLIFSESFVPGTGLCQDRLKMNGRCSYLQR